MPPELHAAQQLVECGVLVVNVLMCGAARSNKVVTLWHRCLGLLVHSTCCSKAALWWHKFQEYDEYGVVGAGSWFCSPECHSIAGRLKAAVARGLTPAGPEHSWQLLRGKDGTHAVTWALKAAMVRTPFSSNPCRSTTLVQRAACTPAHGRSRPPWCARVLCQPLQKQRGRDSTSEKQVAVSCKRLHRCRRAVCSCQSDEPCALPGLSWG